jgi:hypothetical protein
MRAFATGFVFVALGCSSARVGAGNPARPDLENSGGPSITFPAHFAEGNTGKAEDGGAAGAAASTNARTSATRSGRKSPATMPDPDPPLKTALQWEYRLEYAKGNIRVAGVRRVELDRPVVTARHLGRFAFELWIGAELVDRVRFDFPLLAADLPPDGVRRPLHDSPRFGPGAETSQRVLVPSSDRATSAMLVDRLTGSRVPVPWPPDAVATDAANGANTTGEPAKGPPER